MKMMCGKCGFNFSIADAAMDSKKMCPYCGEKRAVQRAKSAEELIRDL